MIKSKRQPKNLKHILTNASFNDNRKIGGSYKCNDKLCATCPQLAEGTTINITSTGEMFKIKTPVNCKSKNVLYIISCQIVITVCRTYELYT